MFQSIVNRAQQSIESLVNKYMTRVAVAVPFVLALGFATAAAMVWLSQNFGSLNAYLIIAGAFTFVGILAASFIALSSPPAIAAVVVQQPLAETNAEAIVDGALNNQELLLALLGTAGPAALPVLLRMLARNAPLVLVVLLIGYLLLSDAKSGNSEPMAASPQAT